MAKKFSKLTKLGMQRLKAGEQIIEHGIEFERMRDGDGAFRINIMVDGKRIHRSLGRESEGMTPLVVWKDMAEMRSNSVNERLGLAKGRKNHISFSVATQRYLEELARSNGKDIPEKRRRLALHLVPYFGKMELSRIDSLSVERYKKLRCGEPSLRGGVRRGATAKDRVPADSTKLTSRATVNREIAVLSHLMNRALEWGWISSLSVKLRRFKEEQTRFEYLTIDEMAALLLAAGGDSNAQIYPFICIGLHTGMRTGEILSLRPEFIDFDKQVIHLPKAKAGARTVPISEALREYLRSYLQSIAADSDWLFASARSKSGHTEGLRDPWLRVVDQAGLKGRPITPHTLRHTAITHLVQAGVDLPTVQKVSGHKTLQMVVRYSHQNQEHVQDALRKLDERIAPDKKVEPIASAA
ncbi:site-specific integrase [Collimonas sp.]|jgi:integrase|uniref:tyrosine-type recombinase/integrase n=1 Tax=Collimonas sp. TaxID=1963772 RepID=UPI002BC02CAF|nr:site-specific integrase [Collimonas sp.]HWW08136.1 site-specific integrase [Collimonas sp.]